MRRFQLIFAIAACVLLAAIGLLVWRAIETVDVERRVRHETVAERVFDEMERALSSFIAAEEERPFGQYGLDPPSLPFVIGYFQIDPDGRLRSARASALGDVEAAVGATWTRDRHEDERRLAAITQEPGSTVELDGNAPSRKLDGAVRGPSPSPRRKPGPRFPQGEARDPLSAYEALRSLNKGVEQRADRQSKISRQHAAAAAPAHAAAMPRASEPPSDRPAAGDADRLELSPMEGRRIGADGLVLFRSVLQGTERHRQGLLLDLKSLGGWLAEEALGSTELRARATLDFESAVAGASREPGELVYQHRFAEPFETLTARLALDALPGLAGGTYVYALSAFSVLAIVLGLGALYRMTSVVLRYAEQRGNFVAAVTHELKTPLTAIRMYGEMLRDGIVASDAKRDEYHRHITAESERLTRLVNNVLEFSRLEKGARRISLEAGDIGAAVREVAELVRPHVEEAGFTLDVTIDPDLPPVPLERDAVMQILFNLVDNAVKYADGVDPKTIELRCGRDGNGARLAVRDRGPGVPPWHLKKIFDPFYRAENELTRRTKGTGLGLALVRSLAERMNARVNARNVPTGGFEVELEFR